MPERATDGVPEPAAELAAEPAAELAAEPAAEPGAVPGPRFRLGYVPGATPAKWVRVWGERRPDTPLELVPLDAVATTAALLAGEVDAALVRLPASDPRPPQGLHAIRLYDEVAVVVVPKEHLLAALEPGEPVPAGSLDDEVLLQPADDPLDWSVTEAGAPPGRAPVEQPGTVALAVELTAAGAGVLVVPQSLARLHHRKDLTYRPYSDGPAAPVALAWPRGEVAGETPPDVDDLVGIVRGRTVNSSRGRTSTEPAAGTGAGKGPGPGAGAGAGKDARRSARGTDRAGGSARGGASTRGGSAGRRGSSSRGGPTPGRRPRKPR